MLQPLDTAREPHINGGESGLDGSVPDLRNRYLLARFRLGQVVEEVIICPKAEFLRHRSQCKLPFSCSYHLCTNCCNVNKIRLGIRLNEQRDCMFVNFRLWVRRSILYP